MPDAPQLKRAMGLWDLVLFNLTAVLSIRWMATAARTGPSSLTLWLLAALLFFIPQGIAVLFLSVRFPEEGGIYRWTRHAFGDFHGFFCGWCYWVSNLVYYPAYLMFAAGVSAYLFGPRWTWLGERAWYSASVALLLLWIAILANVFGLNLGKWVQNVGGISAWVPAMLLIVLGAVAWARAGSANIITPASLRPHWDLGTLSFWSTIAFAFAGLELAPVMSGEIRRPRRNIPLALIVASVAIAFVYIAGTASILAVVPAGDVNVITGILQGLDLVAHRAGLGSLSQLMGLLLPLSVLGGTGAWLAGSARIPFVAGVDRFLPPAFARVHPRWRTPYIAILLQGALGSAFLLLAISGGSLAETYLLLSELTIIIYFVPYLYLFLCLFHFRNMAKPEIQRGELENLDQRSRNQSAYLTAEGAKVPQRCAEETREVTEERRGRREGNLVKEYYTEVEPAETDPARIEVPGGRGNVIAAALAGFAVTALAIVVSLLPSAEVKNVWLYEVKLIGGTLLFFVPGLVLFARRRESRLTTDGHG